MDSHNSTSPIPGINQIELHKDTPMLEKGSTRRLAKDLNLAKEAHELREQTISFLELPREVRDFIYTYALRERNVQAASQTCCS